MIFQAEVAEWQTHGTQNPAGATSCGFDSHLRHQKICFANFFCFFKTKAQQKIAVRCCRSALRIRSLNGTKGLERGSNFFILLIA